MKFWQRIPVKHQYSMVQALYWMSSCALGGYGAVYLQYRGLSNTLIGIAMGGGACFSMGVQPLVAQAAEEIPVFTVKKMVQLLTVLIAGLFALLCLVPMPVMGVMAVYIGMATINNCLPPLLSAMGMEFINRGYYLNFGLSRGMGSIAYAVCAAMLGLVIEKFYPGILGYIYIGLAVLLFLSVSVMKDLGNERRTVRNRFQHEDEVSMLRIVMKNPVLLYLMIGFCLTNMCHAAVGTYAVNIVKNLGGTESILGIANFVMAACEMPVMLLFGWMMGKCSCIRLLKVSAVFFVLKPLFLALAGNLPMAFLGFAMQGMSFGLFTPAAVYYVNNTVAPEKRVKGQAVFSMLTSGAATCVGNFLGGWMQDAFGLKMMLWTCVVMAFAGMLVVMLVPEEHARKTAVNREAKRWGFGRRRKKRVA